MPYLQSVCFNLCVENLNLNSAIIIMSPLRGGQSASRVQIPYAIHSNDQKPFNF